MKNRPSHPPVVVDEVGNDVSFLFAGFVVFILRSTISLRRDVALKVIESTRG